MVFRWPEGLPGQTYQFQMARDPQFSQPVTDVRLAEPEARVARPASAVYYLRVRTIDVDGYQGEFGPTQRIPIPPSNHWPLLILGVLGAILLL